MPAIPLPMTAPLATAEAGGSALASWTPLWVLLGLLAGATVALVVAGRPAPGHGPFGALVTRVADALERVTRIPGWAAAAIGISLHGLLTAGVGFYSDVAWHVALGRDEELFTAPHTAIVIGLFLILGGAVAGVVVATVTGARVGRRWAGLQVPWSMLPLAALGASAVSGFPLDELWHAEYGIDVTMWSPTHMLMILGASFTGLACWLVLGEAGVRPAAGRWARAVHLVAAWLTLQGLAASQGEFAFGVPQFQQLFHPVLVTLAAAFTFVAGRIVLGRFWILGVAAAGFLVRLPGDTGPVATREGGIYLASAAAVELVAWWLGTDRRLRFAAAAGLGAGTVGLAGEWWWNQGAYQPWGPSLLPDAAVLAALAGVAAGLLGAAFARALAGRGRGEVPGPLLLGAAAAVLFTLAWPMPRQVGDVTASVRLEPAGAGRALVHLDVSPSDAADDARWFQAVAWQGGGLELAEMEEVAPGRYVSAAPVPIDGRWKTMVRLHRGNELMTVPIWFPADPAIGEPAIPAVDRTLAFQGEQAYLMREAEPGRRWLAWIIHGLLAGAVALWMGLLALAVRRVERRWWWPDAGGSPVRPAGEQPGGARHHPTVGAVR